MSDIILKEQLECNRVIQQITDKRKRKEGNRILVEVIEKIYELANHAKIEGLSVLEDDLGGLDDVYNGEYLKNMINLLLEITPPETIEKLALEKYYSAKLSGYEGLHYLVMLTGCLAFTSGVLNMYRDGDERIIEGIILPMVPDEVVDLYQRKCKKKSRVLR